MIFLGSMARWPFRDPVSWHVQLADLIHSISVGNDPVELYCLMMGRSLSGHDLMPCISLVGEMREDFHHVHVKPVLDHTFSDHEEEVTWLARASVLLCSCALPVRFFVFCTPEVPCFVPRTATLIQRPLPCLSPPNRLFSCIQRHQTLRLIPCLTGNATSDTQCTSAQLVASYACVDAAPTQIPLTGSASCSRARSGSV